MTFRLNDPWFLLLLAAAPLLVMAWRAIDKTGRARIVFSDLSALRRVPPSRRVALARSTILLRALAAALIAVALARPQYGNKTQEVLSKGIDIMIVLDHSTSMKSPDFQPNRLVAAKEVINKFINGRKTEFSADRIGLVVFSRIASTRCPLTVDYSILERIVGVMPFTREEFDGTAIGSALATAVNRVKDSQAKSKVIILVTDGENNAGLDPLTAAQLAKTFDIKVYVIGIIPDTPMVPVQDPFFGMRWVPRQMDFDDTLLRKIAQSTGGRYFKAGDQEELETIFKEIDSMEKTEVKVKEFYRYEEAFTPWLAAALLLLVTELALSRATLRRLP